MFFNINFKFGWVNVILVTVMIAFVISFAESKSVRGDFDGSKIPIEEGLHLEKVSKEILNMNPSPKLGTLTKLPVTHSRTKRSPYPPGFIRWPSPEKRPCICPPGSSKCPCLEAKGASRKTYNKIRVLRKSRKAV